jgi:hypothetical protein
MVERGSEMVEGWVMVERGLEMVKVEKALVGRVG